MSEILYINIFDTMEIMDAGISESYIFINTAHYIPEVSGETGEIFCTVFVCLPPVYFGDENQTKSENVVL